ncbi:MAG: hypothetical protein HRU17_12540 [Polyangiaceae bacterium]|nr:hypothetical protein [Polyangiaceae bacterium]
MHGFAKSVGIATLSLCSLAGADTTVHISGTLSYGATDNAFGAPTSPPLDVPQPAKTQVFTAAPALLLFHDRPRSRYLLSYQRPYVYYLDMDGANTVADQLSADGIFDVSESDRLELHLQASSSTLAQHTLNGFGTPGVENQSEDVYVQLNAAESWTRDFSGRWRGLQSMGSGLAWPIDVDVEPAFRYQTFAELGIEHLRERDSYAFLTRGNHFHSNAHRVGAVSTAAENHFLGSTTARHRRDLTIVWSIEERLGITSAFDFEGSSAFFPVGGAALRYHSDGNSAELLVERSVGINLILSQVSQIDSMSLNGGIPLWRQQNLSLSATQRVAHHQVGPRAGYWVESAGTFQSEVQVLWTPEHASIALRYQHFQRFAAGGFAPDRQLFNFHRNLVMLTVGGIFPSRDMGPVSTGASQRVDASDRVPLLAPSE